jgi:LytS/YehU family sensor histidine kinase
LSIFGHNNFTGRGPKPTFASGIIIRLILIIVVPLGLRIYERWKNLERTRIQMELSYLKTQINPHFLFNTLNGIYALAIKKSDNTGDAIVKLSSIMRYVITEAANEKVPLEKEIKYIRDFIDLQQLRLSKSTTVNYNVNGNTSGVTIEPLLLITFIENAFKYGVSTEITSSIDIYINMTGKRLQFIVRNDKIARHDNSKALGVGLKNTIDRLNLSHNKNYSLTIDDKEKEFAINLNINLK